MDGEVNQWVLEKIVAGLMLRKSMAVRKIRFFGHIARKKRYGEKIDAREDGRQAERGRPATSWFQDLK